VALLLSAIVAEVTRRRGAIHLTLLLRRVAIIAVTAAAVVGLALLASGQRPRAGLHLLYGLLAVAVVPVAAELARRTPRRGGLYHAAAGLLLLGIAFRLTTTG
jgi:hypothetical protein